METPDVTVDFYLLESADPEIIHMYLVCRACIDSHKDLPGAMVMSLCRKLVRLVNAPKSCTLCVSIRDTHTFVGECAICGGEINKVTNL
jgi:hypothetical protein